MQKKFRIANKECYKSINNRNKHVRRENKVHCSAWTHIWSKKKLLWVYKRTYKIKYHCTVLLTEKITETLSRKHKHSIKNHLNFGAVALDLSDWKGGKGSKHIKFY
jgi:hypothetical protein